MFRLSWKYLLLCASCIFITFPSGQSFPHGASTGSCKSLMPGHFYPKRKTECPYSIQVESTTVEPGGTVQVQVISHGKPFAGLLLQARDDKGMPVGTFRLFDNSRFKTLSCSGGPHNSMTHTTRTPKYNMSCEWTAPAESLSQVQFQAAIVQSFIVYWTPVKSNVVKIQASESSSTVLQNTTSGASLPERFSTRTTPDSSTLNTTKLPMITNITSGKSNVTENSTKIPIVTNITSRGSTASENHTNLPMIANTTRQGNNTTENNTRGMFSTSTWPSLMSSTLNSSSLMTPETNLSTSSSTTRTKVIETTAPTETAKAAAVSRLGSSDALFSGLLKMSNRHSLPNESIQTTTRTQSPYTNSRTTSTKAVSESKSGKMSSQPRIENEPTTTKVSTNEPGSIKQAAIRDFKSEDRTRKFSAVLEVITGKSTDHKEVSKTKPSSSILQKTTLGSFTATTRKPYVTVKPDEIKSLNTPRSTMQTELYFPMVRKTTPNPLTSTRKLETVTKPAAAPTSVVTTAHPPAVPTLPYIHSRNIFALPSTIPIPNTHPTPTVSLQTPNPTLTNFPLIQRLLDKQMFDIQLLQLRQFQLEHQLLSRRLEALLQKEEDSTRPSQVSRGKLRHRKRHRKHYLQILRQYRKMLEAREEQNSKDEFSQFRRPNAKGRGSAEQGYYSPTKHPLRDQSQGFPDERGHVQDKGSNTERDGLSHQTSLGIGLGVGIPVFLAAVVFTYCLVTNSRTSRKRRQRVKRTYI